MQLNDAQKRLIDEFAVLSQQYEPIIKKMKALQELIGTIAAADTSGEAVTLVGDKFSIDYSARAVEMKCIFTPEEFIQHTGAWGALKVGVTEARKLLTPAQMDDLFASQPGARRFQRVRINDVQAYVTAMPTALAKETPKAAVAASRDEALGGTTRRLGGRG